MKTMGFICIGENEVCEFVDWLGDFEVRYWVYRLD